MVLLLNVILILQNQKNYKKRVEKAPVDELFKDDIYTYNIDDPDSDKDPLSKYIDEFVEYCTENIFELFPKKKMLK